MKSPMNSCGDSLFFFFFYRRNCCEPKYFTRQTKPDTGCCPHHTREIGCAGDVRYSRNGFVSLIFTLTNGTLTETHVFPTLSNVNNTMKPQQALVHASCSKCSTRTSPAGTSHARADASSMRPCSAVGSTGPLRFPTLCYKAGDLSIY